MHIAREYRDNAVRTTPDIPGLLSNLEAGVGRFRRMKAQLFGLVVLVACGGSNPVDGHDPDPGSTPDAPGMIPSTITITGNVSETGFSGTSAVEGVATAAFSSADETTPLGTAVTDAQGNYSLEVTLNGGAFDGYLKATKSGYVDLYLYPAGPVSADYSDGSFNMITPSSESSLSSIADGAQQSGKGLIGLLIADASGQPVAGATVSATPAADRYRYMGSNGFPSSSATMTANDGVAFMFSVPDGDITISATKAGMTFRSHVVRARPDAFTSTAIMP